MKEKPILFSGPMIRAILENRKTQTRRIIKPQPLHIVWFEHQKGWCAKIAENQYAMKVCPYGKISDRLWVRETFVVENGGGEYCIEAPTDGSPFHKTTVSDGEGGEQEAIEIPHFRATEPDAAIYSWACMEGDCDHDGDEDECNKTRWKPAIHMPRWASRIDLEVVKVRVERLQDISRGDAWAEGIIPESGVGSSVGPVPQYEKLWESINGEGSWNANPFVWVIEFKRLRP
jgi:hypothetical protein